MTGRADLSELVPLLREGRIAAFADRACLLPAADLAEVLLTFWPDERVSAVSALPVAVAAAALAQISRDDRPELIFAGLGAARSALLVGSLDEDSAAAMLLRLPAEQRAAILGAMHTPAGIRRRLAHDPGSSAGVMTARMVVVGELDPIALAIESVRSQVSAIGELTEIFVVDAARRLVGVLPVRQLLAAGGSTPVRDVMDAVPLSVAPGDRAEHAAALITRYGVSSVAVVDGAGRLLGRVTANEGRSVASEVASVRLLRFGGLSRNASPPGSIRSMIRDRLPALYVSLVTAFAAAALVFLFRDTLVHHVTLVVWLSVVAGVAGNAGTQALATTLRQLGDRGISTKRLRAGLRREAAAGLVNGVILGVVVTGLAVLLGEPWKVGMILVLAMTGAVAFACVAGSVIPRLLQRFGRDPALVSPVVVTVLADACGFTLLLALASHWLD